MQEWLLSCQDMHRALAKLFEDRWLDMQNTPDTHLGTGM